jgi:RHS repeat-associated protein
VAQLDGSNNVVARFVYGSKANVPDYMVTSGGTYRILSDHLGSSRAVVDVSSGNLIETINFDEFGNETDTLAGTLPTGYVRIPFGFAGGMFDPDTGLVRFGARDYDASVGRWTAKDPLRFGGGTLNLYEYAASDPINLIDRSGLDTYACYRPIQFGPFTLPYQDNFIQHEYVCVTREDPVTQSSYVVCGGFGPNGPTSPNNDYFDPSRCQQRSSQDDCEDQCLLEAIGSPRPGSSYQLGSNNCQDWSENNLAKCQAACRQQ